MTIAVESVRCEILMCGEIIEQAVELPRFTDDEV